MFTFGRNNKRSFENETHRKLAALLLDEFVQVISSFELNQIASLTYGTEVCDEIFEMLEEVLGKPLEHTVLALQKSLVVAKHVLIYGSEECVRNAVALGRLVEPLQVYNTVLLQQQRQGATALFYRIKGGGVDKGYPVRDAAKQFYDLVSNPDRIHHVRHTHADPNSLVPVGDDKVVFVTDQVRLYLLNKRMEEQQRVQAKSNLAKANDGFGSGYTSKDGKAVVGAAHGIEEMLAKERKEQMKYRDDGTGSITGAATFDIGYQAPNELLAEALAASGGVGVGVGSDDLLSISNIASTKAHQQEEQQQQQHTMDLLDLSSPAQPVSTSSAAPRDLLSPEHDLLGDLTAPTSASTTSNVSTTVDLFGGGLDLLGTAAAAATTTRTTTTSYSRSGSNASADLLSGGTLDLLGVGSSLPAASTTTDTAHLDLLGLSPVVAAASTSEPSLLLAPQEAILTNGGTGNSSSIGVIQLEQQPISSSKKPIMGSGGSHFSALDALSVPSTSATTTSTHLFAGVKAAEERILGLGGSSFPNTASKDPLSELNGMVMPGLSNLSLTNNNNSKPVENHITLSSISKWGGHDEMGSDSESFGFGGTTMGGQIKATRNSGLTTFGLNANSNNHDPFSSMDVANAALSTSGPSTTSNSFAMSAESTNPLAAPPVMSPPAVLPPVHGGLGVGTTFGEPYTEPYYGGHDQYDNDDYASGFVMGGLVGSGLQPTAPPPPVPPPPPPAF